MEIQSASQEVQKSHVESETVIPAVRGEFYSYHAQFTTERPLGYLMKCKANKDRALAFADGHADELDLVFLFDEHGVRVCSPVSLPAMRLLGDIVDPEMLHKTWISKLDITTELFEGLRRHKNGEEVARICRVVPQAGLVMMLETGMIIAVSTTTGKHGLFLVRELTPSSVKVDACHILL